MPNKALNLLHSDGQHHRSLGALCALWVWIVLACTVVAAFSGLPAQAATGQRVALVVGNAAYADKPLRNPVNDAELMQRTLQGLGFEVSLVRNADRRAFLAGLRDFEAKARNADVALFYFAGHGTQVGGNNYLLPLQAQIRSESDVPDEAVDASSVLRRIEDAKARIGLVILDACRDNPYTGSSRSGSRGLGRMSVPTGSIVAYATAPGSTADDGSGHNGLYTEQLARHLAAPGLDLREVFDRTASEVERLTGGKQKPREDVGLRGRFVLNATQAGQGSQLASVPPLPTGVSVQPPPQPDPDQEAWELAKRRDTVAAYQAYLRRYPQGRYTDSAQVALEGLQPAAPSATAAPAATPSVSTAPAPAAQNTPTAHPISPTPTASQPAADSTLDGRYQILAAGEEVKDLNTGLVWQRCSVGQHWDGQTCAGEAKRFPELHLAQDQARNGWRLPSKNELASLVDSAVGRPAIHPHAFPATPSEWFWSSSTVNSDVSWYANFYDGRVFNELNRRFGYYALVRLVR